MFVHLKLKYSVTAKWIGLYYSGNIATGPALVSSNLSGGAGGWRFGGVGTRDNNKNLNFQLFTNYKVSFHWAKALRMILHRRETSHPLSSYRLGARPQVQ